MRMKVIYVKITSALVAFVFLFQEMLFASGTLSASNSNVAKNDLRSDIGIAVPSDLAQTEKLSVDGKKDLIVNIQDCHASLSAQYSIVKILKELYKKYDLRVVAIEGASGYIDTSVLKTFPDENVKEKTASYLMKEGKISSGEFFSVMADGDIALYGVENNALYNENLRAFRDIYSKNSRCIEVLDSVIGVLESVENAVYSPELSRMVHKSRLHRENSISFDVYWDYLVKQWKDIGFSVPLYPEIEAFMDTVTLEKRVDFDKADEERKNIIARLTEICGTEELQEIVIRSLSLEKGETNEFEYNTWLLSFAEKKGIASSESGEIRKYLEYLGRYFSLDIAGIQNGADEMERMVLNKLFSSDRERRLYRLGRFAELLKALFEVRLTEKDLTALDENIGHLSSREFLEFLRISKEHTATDIAALENGLKVVMKEAVEAAKFYHIAEKRNREMLANTVKAMRREGKSVAALVSGGHHTKGLTDLMKEKGFSYLVLMPKFSEGRPRPYVAILTKKTGPYRDMVKEGSCDLALEALFDTGNALELEEMLAFTIGQAMLSDPGIDINRKKKEWAGLYGLKYENLLKDTSRLAAMEYEPLTPDAFRECLESIDVVHVDMSGCELRIGRNGYKITANAINRVTGTGEGEAVNFIIGNVDRIINRFSDLWHMFEEGMIEKEVAAGFQGGRAFRIMLTWRMVSDTVRSIETPLIDEMIKNGNIVEIFREQDGNGSGVENSEVTEKLVAYRVRWMDDHEPGKADFSIFDEEIDIDELFSKKEQTNMLKWMGEHDLPGNRGPVHFRVALDNISLGWDNEKDYREVSAAGYRDGCIYIGEHLLQHLFGYYDFTLDPFCGLLDEYYEGLLGESAGMRDYAKEYERMYRKIHPVIERVKEKIPLLYGFDEMGSDEQALFRYGGKDRKGEGDVHWGNYAPGPIISPLDPRQPREPVAWGKSQIVTTGIYLEGPRSREIAPSAIKMKMWGGANDDRSNWNERKMEQIYHKSLDRGTVYVFAGRIPPMFEGEFTFQYSIDGGKEWRWANDGTNCKLERSGAVADIEGHGPYQLRGRTIGLYDGRVDLTEMIGQAPVIDVFLENSGDRKNTELELSRYFDGAEFLENRNNRIIHYGDVKISDVVRKSGEETGKMIIYYDDRKRAVIVHINSRLAAQNVSKSNKKEWRRAYIEISVNEKGEATRVVHKRQTKGISWQQLALHLKYSDMDKRFDVLYRLLQKELVLFPVDKAMTHSGTFDLKFIRGLDKALELMRDPKKATDKNIKRIRKIARESGSRAIRGLALGVLKILADAGKLARDEYYKERRYALNRGIIEDMTSVERYIRQDGSMISKKGIDPEKVKNIYIRCVKSDATRSVFRLTFNMDNGEERVSAVEVLHPAFLRPGRGAKKLKEAVRLWQEMSDSGARYVPHISTVRYVDDFSPKMIKSKKLQYMQTRREGDFFVAPMANEDAVVIYDDMVIISREWMEGYDLIDHRACGGVSETEEKMVHVAGIEAYLAMWKNFKDKNGKGPGLVKVTPDKLFVRKRQDGYQGIVFGLEGLKPDLTLKMIVADLERGGFRKEDILFAAQRVLDDEDYLFAEHTLAPENICAVTTGGLANGSLLGMLSNILSKEKGAKGAVRILNDEEQNRSSSQIREALEYLSDRVNDRLTDIPQHLKVLITRRIKFLKEERNAEGKISYYPVRAAQGEVFEMLFAFETGRMNYLIEGFLNDKELSKKENLAKALLRQILLGLEKENRSPWLPAVISQIEGVVFRESVPFDDILKEYAWKNQIKTVMEEDVLGRNLITYQNLPDVNEAKKNAQEFIDTIYSIMQADVENGTLREGGKDERPFRDKDELKIYLTKKFGIRKFVIAGGKGTRFSPEGLVVKQLFKPDNFNTNIKQSRKSAAFGKLDDVIVVDPVTFFHILKMGGEMSEGEEVAIGDVEISPGLREEIRGAIWSLFVDLKNSSVIDEEIEKDLKAIMDEIIEKYLVYARRADGLMDLAMVMSKTESRLATVMGKNRLLAQFIVDKISYTIFKLIAKKKEYLEKYVDTGKKNDLFGKNCMIVLDSGEGHGSAYVEAMEELDEMRELDRARYSVIVHADSPGWGLDRYPNGVFIGYLKTVNMYSPKVEKLPVFTISSKNPYDGRAEGRAIVTVKRARGIQDVPTAIKEWNQMSPDEQERLKEKASGKDPELKFNANVFIIDTPFAYEKKDELKTDFRHDLGKKGREKRRAYEYWLTDFLNIAARMYYKTLRGLDDIKEKLNEVASELDDRVKAPIVKAIDNLEVLKGLLGPLNIAEHMENLQKIREQLYEACNIREHGSALLSARRDIPIMTRLVEVGTNAPEANKTLQRALKYRNDLQSEIIKKIKKLGIDVDDDVTISISDNDVGCDFDLDKVITNIFGDNQEMQKGVIQVVRAESGVMKEVARDISVDQDRWKAYGNTKLRGSIHLGSGVKILKGAMINGGRKSVSITGTSVVHRGVRVNGVSSDNEDIDTDRSLPETRSMQTLPLSGQKYLVDDKKIYEKFNLIVDKGTRIYILDKKAEESVEDIFERVFGKSPREGEKKVIDQIFLYGTIIIDGSVMIENGTVLDGRERDLPIVLVENTRVGKGVHLRGVQAQNTVFAGKKDLNVYTYIQPGYTAISCYNSKFINSYVEYPAIVEDSMVMDSFITSGAKVTNFRLNREIVVGDDDISEDTRMKEEDIFREFINAGPDGTRDEYVPGAYRLEEKPKEDRAEIKGYQIVSARRLYKRFIMDHAMKDLCRSILEKFGRMGGISEKIGRMAGEKTKKKMVEEDRSPAIKRLYDSLSDEEKEESVIQNNLILKIVKTADYEAIEELYKGLSVEEKDEDTIRLYRDFIRNRQIFDGMVKDTRMFLDSPVVEKFTIQQIRHYLIAKTRENLPKTGEYPNNRAMEQFRPMVEDLREYAAGFMNEIGGIDVHDTGEMEKEFRKISILATRFNFFDFSMDPKVFDIGSEVTASDRKGPEFYKDLVDNNVEKKLGLDGSGDLEKLVFGGKKGKFLFLVDNIGEAEFDALIWFFLLRMGHKVVVAAKDGFSFADIDVNGVNEIIDANPYLRPYRKEGMLEVIKSGTTSEGVYIHRFSRDLIENMKDKDLLAVISKGQANLFTLSARNRLNVPVVTMLLSKSITSDMITGIPVKKKAGGEKSVWPIITVIPAGERAHEWENLIGPRGELKKSGKEAARYTLQRFGEVNEEIVWGGSFDMIIGMPSSIYDKLGKEKINELERTSGTYILRVSVGAEEAMVKDLAAAAKARGERCISALIGADAVDVNSPIEEVQKELKSIVSDFAVKAKRDIIMLVNPFVTELTDENVRLIHDADKLKGMIGVLMSLRAGADSMRLGEKSIYDMRINSVYNRYRADYSYELKNYLMSDLPAEQEPRYIVTTVDKVYDLKLLAGSIEERRRTMDVGEGKKDPIEDIIIVRNDQIRDNLEEVLIKTGLSECLKDIRDSGRMIFVDESARLTPKVVFEMVRKAVGQIRKDQVAIGDKTGMINVDPKKPGELFEGEKGLIMVQMKGGNGPASGLYRVLLEIMANNGKLPSGLDKALACSDERYRFYVYLPAVEEVNIDNEARKYEAYVFQVLIKA